VRILALLLLSGSFLSFAGVPVWAQAVLVPDCDTSLYSLQEQLHCLNQALKRQADSNDYLGDILELQDKLKQTELRLYTAELRIETLQNQVSANQEHMEEELTALLMARRPVSNPKAGVSKPKAPVNQAKPVDSPKD
jgi:hypothetical protein